MAATAIPSTQFVTQKPCISTSHKISRSSITYVGNETKDASFTKLRSLSLVPATQTFSKTYSCKVLKFESHGIKAMAASADKQPLPGLLVDLRGFRSRVEYIDINDPTNMCHCVSEILDVGLERPLFMVYVEHNPNEVFAHSSASSCWELVWNRVNNEIIKQHKLGRGELPPLQPLGSLNGMEMFGFSSPVIVQIFTGYLVDITGYLVQASCKVFLGCTDMLTQTSCTYMVNNRLVALSTSRLS